LVRKNAEFSEFLRDQEDDVAEEKSQDVIAALKSIDTVALRLEIDQLEKELADLVADRKRDIDGRREILKAIEVLQHGRQKRPYNSGPRKKRAELKAAQLLLDKSPEPVEPPKQVNSGRKPDRERIATLLREQGAMQLHLIAKKLALDEARANNLMSMDPMFECDRQSGRWRVIG
jgi:hypothetical protein